MTIHSARDSLQVRAFRGAHQKECLHARPVVGCNSMTTSCQTNKSLLLWSSHRCIRSLCSQLTRCAIKHRSMHARRRFAKIKVLLDGQGELACHQKLFNLPFLTLKVRYPAISLLFYWCRYSNEFKCRGDVCGHRGFVLPLVWCNHSA